MQLLGAIVVVVVVVAVDVVVVVVSVAVVTVVVAAVVVLVLALVVTVAADAVAVVVAIPEQISWMASTVVLNADASPCTVMLPVPVAKSNVPIRWNPSGNTVWSTITRVKLPPVLTCSVTLGAGGDEHGVAVSLAWATKGMGP